MKKQHHFWFMVIILLFSACAESELISPTVSSGSFEAALKSHLLYVKNEVSQIIDPETGRPVSIPHLDLIYKTAGNITSSEDPETDLSIAYSLLGRAGDIDCKVPNPKIPLRFPRDHHINPETGFEWYYLGIYLNVSDPEGVEGRIGIVLSIQKQRIIGLTTQKQYGLSDENCMMFVNLVTATVDLPEDHKIIRRNKNFQLPALGGSGGYSSKGEAFYMACGPDTISGSMNVLPLTAQVQDGENLSFNLTFVPPHGMQTKHAFFKQGMPNLSLSGTGYTNDPSPGIYYSWPQLEINTNTENTITVDGISYHISGGGGWMDHQLMMQSLKNAENTQHPIPFIEDPMPLNGWSWQFFNLDNGHAFTGASFQKEKFDPNPKIVYGYYIRPNKKLKKWKTTYMWGDMHLKDLTAMPVITDDPASPAVMLPTIWDYENLQSIHGNLFTGTATPWFRDGSFNGQSRQLISENPVDYQDTANEQLKGIGFCESVGFEHVDAYIKRAVAYLKRKP